DAVPHIVEQSVNPGGGLADRETGRGRDRRQYALEPLPCPLPMRRKLGRDDRRGGMRLGARMARDEADDPLELRGLEPEAGIPAAAPEAIEPKPSVGVDHDF